MACGESGMVPVKQFTDATRVLKRACLCAHNGLIQKICAHALHLLRFQWKVNMMNEAILMYNWLRAQIGHVWHNGYTIWCFLRDTVMVVPHKAMTA